MPKFKVSAKIHKFGFKGKRYLSGEVVEVPAEIAAKIPHILEPVPEPVIVVKVPTVELPPSKDHVPAIGTSEAVSVSAAVNPVNATAGQSEKTSEDTPPATEVKPFLKRKRIP